MTRRMALSKKVCTVEFNLLNINTYLPIILIHRNYLILV